MNEKLKVFLDSKKAIENKAYEEEKNKTSLFQGVLTGLPCAWNHRFRRSRYPIQEDY